MRTDCGLVLGYPQPLLKAVKYGDVDTVALLCRVHCQRPAESVTDSNGVSLLHISAMCNNSEVIRQLIESGAKVDATDSCGCTPLLYATKLGHTESARTLIDRNAQINFQNHLGESPLSVSVYLHENSYCHHEIVLCFVAALKQLQASERSKAKMLLDAKWTLPYAAQLNNAKIVDLMIELGASVDARNHLGVSALHYAVCNHRETVAVLLKRGADVNIRDVAGVAPIHDVHDPRVLAMLLARDAQLYDTVTETGRMQCYQIVRGKNVEMVKQLLERGLNFDARDAHGDALLHYVASIPDSQFHGMVVKRDFYMDRRNAAGETALHIAADICNWQCMEILLERGADPDVRDSRGQTPLHRVFRNNAGGRRCRDYDRTHALRLLLRYEASIDETILAHTEDIRRIIRHEDLAFYKIRYGHVSYLMVKQLARLVAQGVAVPGDVVRAIGNEASATQYYEDCRAEIAALRECRFYEAVTLFDLLEAGVDRMDGYVRNRRLVKAFYEVNRLSSENFLIYGSTLVLKFKRRLGRVKSARAVSGFLRATFPRLPDVVVRKIVQFLSEEDARRINNFEHAS